MHNLTCLFCFIGIHMSWAADPVTQPKYSFSGDEQHSIGNLRYQTRLLRGSDGGLIGVSLRLSNTSAITSLKIALPTNRPAFHVIIYASNNEELTLGRRMALTKARSRDIQKNESGVRILAPEAVEDYFVAVGDVLPENFDAHISMRCRLVVLPLALPYDTDFRPSGKIYIDSITHAPSFTLENIALTNSSLKVDAQAAYREASKSLK